MKVAPVIDIHSVPNSIELQKAVNVPAGTLQPFRFKIAKGQKLSSFYNKIEHGSEQGSDATLADFVPTGGPNPGHLLAAIKTPGAGQRFFNHSDDGVSGSLNLEPGKWYYASFSWPDGKAHKLQLAYGNGGG